MAEQESGHKFSMSRRNLMKMAGATLVGGCLTTKEARGETVGAGNTETSFPVSGKQEKIKRSDKYPLLLSPLKIGNHVFKNHMIALACSAHSIVGPEAYPNDPLITHYANLARKGASLVIVTQPYGIHPTNDMDVLKQRGGPQSVNPDHGGDNGHYASFDLADGGCQNMLSQLTEAVHFYGAKILLKPKFKSPTGYDVSAGGGSEMGSPGGGSKEIPEEMIQKIIDDTTLEASLAKEVGFDGFYMHMCYRAPITARFLSPLTNKRTDKYGGSLENRARFCLTLLQAIKQRCGQDFFLLGGMSGCEPEGGFTLDDGAEYAKMFAPYLDLLNLKGDPGERDSAPTNFIKERTPFLYMTEAYKKRGVKIPLCSDGGFMDIDHSEETLAAGKVDVIAMARAWITNPEYERLVFEGRNEDVVPCIRCNRCHFQGMFHPYNSVCSVNPVWGLEHKIHRMISPPQDKKTVAVIGGGPAGMEAALIASQRGHEVTLYEKTDSLGGNFKTVENVSFKWPHKDFKDYLVRQIGRYGVKVRLNTEADPSMIKKGGYDAVIMAIGAAPVVPDISGIKGDNVVFATSVYGKENTLAKDVIIIGGGYVGTETGMHLAEKGHMVTVLEAKGVLAWEDSGRPHYTSAIQHAWEQLPNFKFVLQATCNGITKDWVTYVDAGGRQQSIKAGSVIVAAGMKAKTDMALKFSNAGDRFYMVGDCEVSDILTRAMRTAFTAASML